MATYKPGQRVRIIACYPVGPDAPNIGPDAPEVVGCEGTIVGPYIGPRGPWDYEMFVDGYGRRLLCVQANEIVPLDPPAQAFVESIKKLKPYEEPKVVTKPAVHTD